MGGKWRQLYLNNNKKKEKRAITGSFTRVKIICDYIYIYINSLKRILKLALTLTTKIKNAKEEIKNM